MFSSFAPSLAQFVPLGSIFPARKVLRKLADENRVSTTVLADDADFVLAIGARETWHFYWSLVFFNALTTTGVKCAVTGPAGASQDNVAWLNADTATLAGDNLRRSSGSGGAFDWTTVQIGAGVLNGHVFLETHIINGATPGPVRLRFAQSTSSATPLTLKASLSVMYADRLPQ